MEIVFAVEKGILKGKKPVRTPKTMYSTSKYLVYRELVERRSGYGVVYPVVEVMQL